MLCQSTTLREAAVASFADNTVELNAFLASSRLDHFVKLINQSAVGAMKQYVNIG